MAFLHKSNSLLFSFLCRCHSAECLSPTNNFSLSHTEIREIFFHFHHHCTFLFISHLASSSRRNFGTRSLNNKNSEVAYWMSKVIKNCIGFTWRHFLIDWSRQLPPLYSFPSLQLKSFYGSLCYFPLFRLAVAISLVSLPQGSTEMCFHCIQSNFLFCWLSVRVGNKNFQSGSWNQLWSFRARPLVSGPVPKWGGTSCMANYYVPNTYYALYFTHI